MREEIEDYSLDGTVIRDATQPLDPDTFDLAGYVTGKRTTRTAVLIPEKASLLGEIKKLEYRIDHAPDDADVDDLIERFQALVASYEAGQRFWTIEARSPEWVTEFNAAFAKANSIKLTKDGNATNEHDTVLIVSGQLAEQVVEIEPLHGGETVTEVTVEELVALYEENAVLWTMLAQAKEQVNTQVPQAEPVLTRDFSRRSSTGRSGTAS